MKKMRTKMPLSIIILLTLTAALIVVSFLAPYLYPIDLGETSLTERLAKPSIFGISDSGHLLGCDYLGRDLAIRLLYATRTTIVLAFTGLSLAALLGITLGVLAGMFGGVLDDIVMFMVNVRYGFLTCYDFYFYEAYPNIARQNVDVIIGCSHQRSDTLQAIELINRFLAYHTNAYVIRSSVCMEVGGNIGGGSQIVSPFCEVLADMANQVGMVCAEFDPHSKYFKPAGFGNPPAAHYEYIDLGRRPWHYRPGGSAIARPDCWMNYPRVCAHRGYTAAGPENSLAALAAAVAMGAEEIEFDLWSTTDGEFVVVHDENLERLSNGTGKVWEHSYEELKVLDFGTKPGYEGLKVTTFEKILKKLSCHAVMNIHLKTPDGSLEAYDEAQLQKMIDLIYKYDCTKHVYIMTGNDTVLKQLKGMAPWLQLCCGGGARPWDIVDRAIEIGCQKVQLFKPYFNQKMVDKAHAHGIRCNVFYADDPEEANRYLEMGIDTILTNNYRVIAQTVARFKK